LSRPVPGTRIHAKSKSIWVAACRPIRIDLNQTER
jgi:hypothetical protein